MSPEEAAEHILAAFALTRDDIARAKSYVLQNLNATSNTDALANNWLQEQKLELRDTVNLNAPELETVLAAIGRSYSVRVALYVAVWELAAATELYPSHSPTDWKPTLTYESSGHSGGVPLSLNFHYLPHVHRPPLVTGLPDTDVFLQGIDNQSLHDGIREAIDQSLGCFRRGLYMPAIAMLTAAVEAAWTECGLAVAKKLANTKLETILTEQLTGIGKIVQETRKALEVGAAKPLLKKADRTVSNILEAESWTAVLRDKRNALHWGKSRSFIVDHSGAASILMGAPIHLGTLEAIRTAC